MILPIYLYGQQVLRKATDEVTSEYPDLEKLAQDMFQTMEKANGVGLAAPQVGLSIRMFVVDGSGLTEDYPECKDIRRCMINPEIIEEADTQNSKDEGCLSIPGVYEAVKRPDWIVIKYQDEKLVEHEERLEGFAARMVLHEYDHLDGKMFIDRVSPMRKAFMKGKLNDIIKGKTHTQYKSKSIK